MSTTIDFSKLEVADGRVRPEEIAKLITFFNGLEVFVDEITTDVQAGNGQKVVRVHYIVESKEFVTKPLYYRNVNVAASVKNAGQLLKYFGDEVFWLDLDHHAWP